MTCSLPSFFWFSLRALSLLLLSSGLLAQAQSSVTPATTGAQTGQPGTTVPEINLLPTDHQPLPVPAPTRSARLMAPAASTIRYVKAGATGTGATWSNASGDLQAMINASASGDQVWMAGGTYKPSTSGLTDARSATFRAKAGVTILGGFTGATGTEGNAGARTTTPSSTTLSGDLGTIGDQADNAYHVVYVGLNAGEVALLDGLCMTGGNANGSTGTDKRGGGIWISGNVSLANCQITGNTCIELGGGIYLQNGATGGSWNNCQIINNSAPQGNGSGAGGALLNCSNYQLRNCQFTANQTSYLGGGLYISGSTPIQLVSCVFDQNAATAFGGFGAGLNLNYSSATIVNSFFTRNRGNYGGGLLSGNGSVATCINTTIRANTSGVAGGAVYSFNDGRINLTNCVLWGNGGQNVAAGFNNYFSYTLTQPIPFNYNDQGGNIIATFDPFENSTGPDLKACAPAIDAGSDAVNATTTDVLGNARKVRTIDMGAAEFRGTSYTLSVTAQATPSVVCVGISTSLQATPSGSPNTPYSYTWVAPAGATLSSTSDNPTLVKPTTAGTPNFTVNVTDRLGCLATASVSVTANAVPTQYSVTGGGSYCVGSNGVVVGLSGSETGVNYQLQRDGKAVGNTIAGTGSALSFGSQTAAGNYTVQATNASTACQQSMTGSAVVTPNPLPTPFSVTGGGSYCAAGSGVVVGLAGSQTGVSYQLLRDGNAVGNAVAGTGSALSFGSQTTTGTYTVQAINTSTTCQQTMSGSATVIVGNLPTAGLINNGPLSCTMTTVTLTATGGRSYTFTDGNGQVLTGTGDTRSVNSPGIYTVRVANEAGCTSTTTTSVTSNTVVVTATLSASPSTTLTCSQPTLTLTASGGDTYRFSPTVASQSGNRATVTQAGVYSVTATSTTTGCFSTTSITISQDNAAPSASLASSGPLSCTMTSMTLTASPGGQSYRFSDGAMPIGTTNQAMVTTAGIYSVTVLAGNGCSSVASTTVTGDQTPPTVSISPSSATLTCANPSATLTAVGTGSFRWNTGAQTTTITATTAGPYSVTVMGSNGCVATASALVSSDQTAPSVNITPTSGTLTCASPTLTLTANTSAPTLLWSNGQTTPSITVNTAGTYSVTATGSNGCSGTSNAVHIESAQDVPPATLVASGGLSCAVTSVTLTANAGDELSYRFSSGVTQMGTSNTATVNIAGTYSVTVTNTATGCTNTASTVVTQDNSQPTVSISPTTATLTCGLPTATLTASTSVSSLTWSTGQTTSSISVSASGTYSVTVTSANGCMAMAQATISGTTNAPTAPTLAASPATATTNQPITVTANGCPGGTINWTALGGTGQANGNTYTLSQPGNYTLSATCSLNGCTSSSSTPLSVQIRPGGFAITGVSMVNCQLIDEAKGGYQVQFTPQYAGQNSNPISFSVVNELAPTTAPAPYALRLYTDNPVITLVATQAGNAEARFAYNWLASCQSGTSPNQPPTTTGVPSQSILVGQGYQLQLATYFSDPDGQALSFQASGLPAGLSLSGSIISGAPSQTGVSTVNVTAIDPGGLQVSTSFQLTVNPMPVTPPTGFAIVGVSTVSCQVLSAGERRLTFTPQYAGVSAAPISFSVVNELVATTNPGPYSLNLYTDNPTITLSAQQGATVSTYRYNWLAVCTPSARIGSGEAGARLTVRVLGNPVAGNSAEVEINGAAGQPVQLNVVDGQGKSVHTQRIDQAGAVERVSLSLGASNGVLLLRVSTPTQQQHVKLLRF